jgi:flagellar biosynthesis/type III secretory pathway protein FliH
MRAVVKEMRARVPRDDERADLFAALLVLAEVDPWGHTLRKEIEAMLRESTFDMMTVSKTLRDAYEAGQREGIEQGLEKGIEKGVERMLRGLFAKRLHRALTARERKVLAARATSAPDEAQEKVLALEGEALAAWLNGPVPKKPAPARARRRAASPSVG